MNRLLRSRSCVPLCAVYLATCIAATAVGEPDDNPATPAAPQPSTRITTKLFFEDDSKPPKTHFAVKVTVFNSPDSGIVHFSLRGEDNDKMILADLYMHAMVLTKGQDATCTKRFAIDTADYQQIKRWKFVEYQEVALPGLWNIGSMTTKSLPNKEISEWGDVFLRFKATYSGPTPPDQIPIQGLDADGFEVCHFRLDDYNVTSGARSDSRRGRWDVDGSTVAIDALVPLRGDVWDFTTIPALRRWRALPMQPKKENLYRMFPWDGDVP